MNPWASYRSPAARRAAISEALHASGGNVTAAATLLGLSRRHLTRLLSETQRLRRTGETGETTSLNGTPRGDRSAGTPTVGSSLTYGQTDPSLRVVTSAPTITSEAMETVDIQVSLPRDLAAWLELEALLLKQQKGASRASKSVVVAEALEEYRRRRQQP
jgi:hypothetical protein